MDDVKDKVKGLMKKVNNPFSSNSSSSGGRFKGQGRVLGGSSSSSSSKPVAPPTDPTRPRPDPQPVSKPSPHLPPSSSSSDPPQISNPSNTQLSDCVSAFVSRGNSVEIVVKLFKNIVKEPENPKFRRIRLSNPKIRETVVEVVGGVELLECVGFKLQEEEDGEMWAVIVDVPKEEEVSLIREAVLLLERPEPPPPLVFSFRREVSAQTAEDNVVGVSNSVNSDEPELPQTIDRQARVFFSAPGNATPKTDVPESFYSLSASELKREADARKKQLAESQLLIPKSYKEEKAKDARKRYKTTVIRIQFPDEVVLQGVFLPWEPATALYEFVSSALKDPCVEFELWRPAIPRPRVISRFPGPRERTPPTLDQEELVPSALIKFKPIETDSCVFTGLSNELLQISEPLMK